MDPDQRDQVSVEESDAGDSGCPGAALDAARRDPARIQRWSVDLGRKGLAVNEKLTTLLGRQDARLATLVLPHERKPGATPIERLRGFLRQISDAQKRLRTPDFGLCRQCAAPLPLAVLDESPWAEVCARCAAREAGVSVR